MNADPTSNPIALVTSDQDLAATVRELCLAAGLRLHVLDRASESGLGISPSAPDSMLLVDSRSWDSSDAAPANAECAVMLAVEPCDSAWEKAAVSGFAEVIAWPQGSSWLVRRLGGLPTSSASQAPVIAVLGGRGGCGTTTFAVALAVAAAEQGLATVLVDADSCGYGFSRALGITEGEGLRWADFSDIDEPPSAAGLRSQLADAGKFSVLTGPWGSGSATATSRRYALVACEQAFDLVVVDVPRYELTVAGVSPSASWVVLTTLEVRSLMTTAALLSGPQVPSSASVVVRSDVGPVPHKSAQALLDPAVVRRLSGSRGIQGAADFGDLGAAVGRGPIAALANELVTRRRNGAPGG
jgi:secretion/DNA translocation related CpaE-like protein